MLTAFVNNNLIRWARERSSLTIEAAAEHTHVTVSKLAAWEQGNRLPTMREAANLANRYRIPLGYLYLSEPPQEELPLPDLRVLPGAATGDISPDFIEVIHDAQRKQAWYREELEAANSPELPFIGRFTLSSTPEVIADEIRTTLRIDNNMRNAADTWETFLTVFIRSTEDNGVVVLRSGVVESNNNRKLRVEEFRGFVIADRLAPLIFLNSQDAKAAQIFTLAHELAHLWLDESGVSNPDFRRKAHDQAHPVERLCNRVAAETLLPRADFTADWRSSQEPSRNVRSLARRYKVSSVVVLRQALDLDVVDEGTYWKLFLEERNRQQRPHQGSGGDFYNTFLARNSRRLTSALLVAIAEGRISRIDAARLVNIRATTLRSLADHEFGMQL